MIGSKKGASILPADEVNVNCVRSVLVFFGPREMHLGSKLFTVGVLCLRCYRNRCFSPFFDENFL